ncbi:MAG TPA: type II toxin-antitoxin system VapC family toxin [Caulobacteraceae bacterium]|nr:type II toxin-antitoxin system VapC family toxin [Caulobacteraceae bacterium]
MRLLLDTHVFLAVVNERRDQLDPTLRRLLQDPAGEFHVSVASLWEIAIKHRLGKLTLLVELETLPETVAAMGADLIAITARHVLAQADPEPPTCDPFNRLLLSQCQTEGLRLMTIDRALVGHPLAARAG